MCVCAPGRLCVRFSRECVINRFLGKGVFHNLKKKWMTGQASKANLKHANPPLVAGCRTHHAPGLVKGTRGGHSEAQSAAL